MSQGEELLPKLQRGPQFPPLRIKTPESPQHRAELWRLSHLLTELARPGVGAFDFRHCRAFGGYQCRTQGELDFQLTLGALGRVREGAEHLQPLCEVCNRL